MRFQSRTSRRTGIYLLLLIGALTAWLSSPQSATAQSACASRYCLLLPIVATPYPVHVTYRLYPPSNSVDFDGFIETTDQKPVYNVLLEGRVFNAAGTLLQTVLISPTLEATLPGQTNPFYTRISVCCNPVRTEVRPVSWQRTSSQSYVALPVTTVYWTSAGFKVTVHNDQQVPVHDVLVVVQEDTLIFHTQRFDNLAPGETRSYELDLLDAFGFRFKTWAQGHF